jgi:hypothetical protein
VLLLAAAVSLSGCLVVPLPQGEGELTEGREILPEQSGIITVGSMTREELVAALGEPQAAWAERRIIVYAWDRVHLKLLWIVAGYLTATGGIVDVPTHYLLLVAFDEQDRVRRAERCQRPVTTSFGAFLRAWADGAPCR